MTKVIGLSLSRCVNDIAAGRIEYDDVEKIIARTAFSTAEAIGEGIEDYKRQAWIDHPEAAEAIAKRLFSEDKVEQPRLNGEWPELVNEDFHWIDAKTNEVVTTPEINKAASTLEIDRLCALLVGSPARKPGFAEPN